jgi:TolB-like protein
MSASPDIFLSYNREDQAVAKRFAEAFEAEGFSVWWDVTLRSGEAYDQVTEEALRTAKAVVVLWSQRSANSRWVRAEATLADRSRTLVPARIEPCDLPIMFELTQTADLSHWQGDRCDPTWVTFLADVREFTGARREPTARVAVPQASKSPLRGGRPSIAILPFINRSEMREDEVFANGMVDDLTVALSASRRIKVVASSATAAYRKEARDLRQIGRELGVRYLLEGNVRRVGDTLRVTAQLVEAETDNILWSRKFDRPLVELAALQEDLAAEVAAHLGVQVTRAELEHALRKPGDITAWEAMLRSDYHLFRGSQSGYEAAVAEARRAVEIAPDYGPAYAVLAAAQAQLLRSHGHDKSELARELAETTKRACAFGPNSPLVLCRISAAYLGMDKLDEAMMFAERGIMLNPNIDMLHQVMSTIYLKLGEPEAALAELDAADGLSPNSPWFPANTFNRSLAHLQADRLDCALQAADQAVRLYSAPEVLIQQAICLAATGQRERAVNVIRSVQAEHTELTLPRAKGLYSALLGSLSATSKYLNLLQSLWGAVDHSERPS